MAYHMFFGFNLAPGVSAERFEAALDALAQDLIAADVLISMDPLGRRHKHDVLDTDDGNSREFFTTMHFRDLTQADASVAHIQGRHEPVASAHIDIIRQIRDSVFLCFQDRH